MPGIWKGIEVTRKENKERKGGKGEMHSEIVIFVDRLSRLASAGSFTTTNRNRVEDSSDLAVSWTRHHKTPII